jgi:hypothetical protein
MEIGRIIAAFAASVVASAQPSADLRPAEKVFKNVQALKGISANEFMDEADRAAHRSSGRTARRRRYNRV